MGMCDQQHTLVGLPWDISQKGRCVLQTALKDAENLATIGIRTQIIQPIAVTIPTELSRPQTSCFCSL